MASWSYHNGKQPQCQIAQTQIFTNTDDELPLCVTASFLGLLCVNEPISRRTTSTSHALDRRFIAVR